MKKIFLFSLCLIFLITTFPKSVSAIDGAGNSQCAAWNNFGYRTLAGPLTMAPTATPNRFLFSLTDPTILDGVYAIFYSPAGGTIQRINPDAQATGGNLSFEADFKVKGVYNIWIESSLACNVILEFTVTQGSEPVPTPTPQPPPPGSTCLPQGSTCQVDGPLFCCRTPDISIDLECLPDVSDLQYKCIAPTPIPTIPFDPCLKLTDPDKTACYQCRGPAADGAYTAIGCVPLQPGQFIAQLANLLIIIGTGVAFLLILYGSFLCLTSRGNPQQTQACRETITGAVVGIILLIFALILVRVIFGPSGILPGYITLF